MSSETNPTPPAATPRGLDALIWANPSPFTRWLERWRHVFFILLVLFILIPFNGQWRLGLDSSIYRGVAQSLATGHGYTFAGRAQTQVYPGLPFLLAGLQKITGSASVIPPLIVMNAMSLLTLWVVYHLIRLRYPVWIAVVVTCGVGINARYVQQAQEIMTDTPFLLGCVTAMLGWERLGAVTTRRGMVTSTLILIVGLFLAATMRPTFWVLAVAWVASAGWNIVWRREKRSMIAMAALAVVLCAFLLLDPRFHGMNLLQGSYEKQFVQNLYSLPEHIRENAPALFTRELCEAFFGEPMAWFGPLFSLGLLAGAALVARRQPVWGLQVFILTGIMLMLSEIPRYYLMVLPTLWLGYVLILLVILQKCSTLRRDVLLFFFFSLANFMNGGTIVMSFIPEQHNRDFLKSYRHGAYVPIVKLANALHDRMQPGDNAIGPVGQVLSFLSGRNVLNGKLLGFETQGITKHPALVAAADPKFLVGPVSLYDNKDPAIYRLLTHGVIVPGILLEKIDDMWISRVSIKVPTTDWRNLPTTRPYALADRPPKHHMTPEEIARRARKAKRQLLAERAARRARNARKLRRLRRAAATQETTQPSPAPTPQPSPATQPATQPTTWAVPLHHLGLPLFDPHPAAPAHPQA